MMDVGDVPFDEMMELNGVEHRLDLLKGLVAYPDDPVFLYSLKEADDWFRAHGINPETIQLYPSQIEAVKKRKREIFGHDRW